MHGWLYGPQHGKQLLSYSESQAELAEQRHLFEQAPYAPNVQSVLQEAVFVAPGQLLPAQEVDTVVAELQVAPAQAPVGEPHVQPDSHGKYCFPPQADAPQSTALNEPATHPQL